MKIVAWLILLASTASSAALLRPFGEIKKIENVSIAKTFKVNIETKEFELTSLAAGLRKEKPIAIFPTAKFYVLQVATTQPEQFARPWDQALTSFDATDVISVQLNFVRDAEAQKVSLAFREGLSANSVDMKKPEITAVLKAVDNAGEAVSGKSLTLVMSKNPDGTETVWVENYSGKISTIQGNRGLIKGLLSIWYGAAPVGD